MLKLNCTIKWVMAIAITTYLGQATAGELQQGNNWLGPLGGDGVFVRGADEKSGVIIGDNHFKRYSGGLTGHSVINKIDCKSVGKIPKRGGKYVLVALAGFAKQPILFSEKDMRQLRKKCESR